MYRNIHGRKPGRGIRPYLLLPKVVAVGAGLGGLLAAAVIWFSPWLDLAAQQRAAIMRHLFVGLIGPALFISMMLGVLLWMQHPHQFVRMRWWQVKMGLIAVMLPGGGAFVGRQMAAVQQGHQAAGPLLSLGLVVLTVSLIGLIVLGRHKPRLGQNWARVFARQKGDQA